MLDTVREWNMFGIKFTLAVVLSAYDVRLTAAIGYPVNSSDTSSQLKG
jgi:hypothetical protein